MRVNCSGFGLLGNPDYQKFKSKNSFYSFTSRPSTLDEQSILGTRRTKSNGSAADPISLYSSPKFPRQSPALIALQAASLDHEDKRKHLSFFGERRFGRVS